MKSPLIRRPLQNRVDGERGVTMVLVAVAMVAIIAMAALSIDVITLYLAREEAQRTADAAALAAARVLSLSGVTADPNNVQGSLPAPPWPTACNAATQSAQAVANQNAVGGVVASTTTVTFVYNGTTADCTNPSAGFAINPQVQVKVIQRGLPTFFSRIWGRAADSISVTATAEVFNSSNSGTVAPAGIVPVIPRCVKPWVVPNLDPRNPDGCTNNCTPFIDRATGAIQHAGISLNGVGTDGTVGESFWLESNCIYNRPACDQLRSTGASPPTAIQANLPTNSILYREPPPNLLYWPNQVGTPPASAVPACARGNPYEEASGGCEATTNYHCGEPNANFLDLTLNPDSGSVTNGVACLINQQNLNDTADSSGQDYLSPSSTFGGPTTYPFQILAGTWNPLVTSAGLAKDTPISASLSIVSLPIYDQTTASITAGAGPGSNQVTFIGFLQVFINAVDPYGNINVTVLNVTGCSNNATGTAVAGSSPVPIRLITPP